MEVQFGSDSLSLMPSGETILTSAATGECSQGPGEARASSLQVKGPGSGPQPFKSTDISLFLLLPPGCPASICLATVFWGGGVVGRRMRSRGPEDGPLGPGPIQTCFSGLLCDPGKKL